MRKILILTTATGEGHNQAAKSLKEILKTEYDEVDIFDFLEKSKTVNDFVVGGYELSAKIFPYIYGFCYAISDFKPVNSVLEFFLREPIKKTVDYINKFNPDVIACTHPLAVCILGALSRKGIINIPTISIITDFKPHYTYYSDQINAYITGSEYTKQELTRFGVLSENVFPIGIPVGQAFYARYETPKINPIPFNILVMGGSMGLSGISKVLKHLVTNTNDIKITLICGKNIELKNSLESKYPNNPNLKIFGFTTEVSTIMDSMDLIITKPGGLTTTESIHKALPMIIPFVIPGQETDNSKLLVREQAAIRVKNLNTLNSVLNDLILNPEKLQSLKLNMKRLSENYSIDQTIQLFNDLSNKKPQS